MAPTLLSFLQCLTMLFGTAGSPIRYHFDGKLFSLRRFQAKSKMKAEVLNKLLYTGDRVENVKQKGRDRVLQACANYDLTVSIKGQT